LRSRAKNESILKFFGVFIVVVLITIFLFYLLATFLAPEGDMGLLILVALVISLQISFITAYLITNLNK
jgi:putative flippase GtrA